MYPDSYPCVVRYLNSACASRSVHGGVSWLRGGSGSLSLGSELNFLRGVSPPARGIEGGGAEHGTGGGNGGNDGGTDKGGEAGQPQASGVLPAREAASNVSEGTLVRGGSRCQDMGSSGD